MHVHKPNKSRFLTSPDWGENLFWLKIDNEPAVDWPSVESTKVSETDKNFKCSGLILSPKQFFFRSDEKIVKKIKNPEWKMYLK